MNINWLKDQDNIVYADINKFSDNFGKEVGIPNLREKIENFKKNPDPNGIHLKGNKRTSLKVFVPNLMFDEQIDMGDSIWVYLGENYEGYCLYWPEEIKS